MVPYCNFDKDKNPFLVIHDKNSGLYFLNVNTKVRTPIFQTWKPPQKKIKKKTRQRDGQSSESSSQESDDSDNDELKKRF